MAENPYEPSQVSDSGSAYRQPMQTSRPVSVTVFGILNLVFAAWGLCGIGFSMLAFAIPQNANFPNPVLQIMEENRFYMVFTYSSLLLGSVFSVILAIGGVGLLQFKPYGRTLSIAYSVYSIAICIVGSVVSYFCLVAPLLNQGGANNAARASAIGGAIGGLIGGLLGLIYPVLLLAFMYRQNVVQALRPRGPDLP